MPLYVIQVRCDLCSGEHGDGIVLKVDDGPIAKESVASFYAGKPVPKDLAVRHHTFTCPATGETFSPKTDDNVFIVPAPYRL